MINFTSTFRPKLIYAFRINDNEHANLIKVGEASFQTTQPLEDILPNSKELNQFARERINQYTTTAGIKYELLYTEVAFHYINENGAKKLKAFNDHAVHDVLLRSGVSRHFFDTQNKANEWFKTDLETVKNAIRAVKEGRKSLTTEEISEDKSPIIFRPEQQEAIDKTVKQFKKGNNMLWNAKMRFGKTLCALQVAKEMQFKRTIILTHRPAVSDGWYEDFKKIFYDTNYQYASRTHGDRIENLVDTDQNFVYFASLQDLRGSEAVGGKFDKNDYVFATDWDFIVIDEAHEGTLTKLGQSVIDLLNTSKKEKVLRLSGTPFNLMDKFSENEIFTWDYVMEQKAKLNWLKQHFGDNNPYENLPKLEIFTYNLNKLMPGYVDVEDSAFNFKEFFRVWTGDPRKDFKPVPQDSNVGDFVHKKDVIRFLNMLCHTSDDSNYPFSTEEYRNYFRHSLWMLPGVKEAKALSALLKTHPVFGNGNFEIVNVAGAGDEEIDTSDALNAVRKAFGDNPDQTYSITLSCGRLTTGVTVPEWTAVFMLAGTFSTSASSYLQTIFRVQSPANINGRVKEVCCVFDFAPDRTLKMVAEAGKLSTKTGNTSADRKVMGEFLNFCPVIAVDGSSMQPYNVDRLLQQLKKVYTDRVVRNGFDDNHIYNDNMLKLNDIELADFEELKKIVGASKQTEKVKEIDINNQGFTDEEYEEIEHIEAKPKKERTPEEIAKLEEKKKKRENAQKAMSILRGISIRIPLLIYGADVPVDKDITVDNFVELIDDLSWEEFMPKGVTKEIYKKFAKYYEQDIFVSAGRQIRNIALSSDKLSPLERVKKIAGLFATFKNPDKETVLTPWRVVNMHMSDCLGGYCFFNEDFSETIDEPRFVDRGKVTSDTFSNINAKILEINSKTGLYPLYVTYSIFAERCKQSDINALSIENQYNLWKKTVEDNLYIICKTPMAKSITRRTLLGYRQGKINAHAFNDLIMQLKEKPDQFKEKVLRGSFWNKESKEMNFDAIVGNPPYQIMDGGHGSSSLPVYNIFVEKCKLLNPHYLSIIMPSRWMTGGKGLDGFRTNMINDKSISILHDYLKSSSCFESVQIEGGVCYFLWDRENTGPCKITSHLTDETIKISIMYLNELNTDVVLRDNRFVAILSKTKSINDLTLDKITHPRNPFGISSLTSTDILENKENAKYSILGRFDNKRAIKYLSQNFSLSKNESLANSWKVFVSKADGAAGQIGNPIPAKIIGKAEIGFPNMICTETFLAMGPFDSLEFVKALIKYMETKFLRFLVGIRKNKNMTRDTYAFVPLQDFTDNSDIDWSKSVAEIDQQLYKKYNLSEEEINFIETMIKPMN